VQVLAVLLVVQASTLPIAQISTTFVAQAPTTALIPCSCLFAESKNGEEPQALGKIALVLPLCCIQLSTVA